MIPTAPARSSFGISSRTIASAITLSTANHPLVGAERIIWASDYPHPDAKFPGVVKELAEATASLTDAQRMCIFGANARDVYGLPAAG